MSLVFEAPPGKLAAAQPATHVLLVGCGEYPSLSAAGYASLSPLTSPRRSAEAMANWFLSGPDACAPGAALPPERAFHNPAAPLGSVELLASPSGHYVAPCSQPQPVERPTRDNIAAAYRRWLGRLAANPDSRGIFYFSGHGVGDGVDQVLIADDFGADLNDLWSASFHLSNTCHASIRKTSAKLMYLIDACMEYSPDLLAEISEPRPLVTGTRLGTPLCSDWLVMRATTANLLAYAPVNGIARFTRALLDALNGHCGSQRIQQQCFDVTPAALRSAASAFLSFYQAPGDAKQQRIGTPQGDGAWDAAFHVLTKRPCSHVQLDVEPPGFRPVTQAYMLRAGAPRLSKALGAGPAHFSVEWGEWTYGVQPSSAGAFTGQYRTVLLNQAVLPDTFTIT